MRTFADKSTPLASRIGVFDSGLGGLSVLRALRERLPSADLHYLADSKYAPYGERSTDEIVQRSLAIAQTLLNAGAGILVVACNTATAHAVQALRGRWPDLPIVGVEPGVKPAVALSPLGRIGVMATPATIKSSRFATLLERYAGQAHWHLQPCPGLAAAIETHALTDPHLGEVARPFVDALLRAQVDTVVLGCTHYPLIADVLREQFGPAVRLVDTSAAVAEQAAKRYEASPLPSATSIARLVIQTTGGIERLRLVTQQWLNLAVQVDIIDC